METRDSETNAKSTQSLKEFIFFAVTSFLAFAIDYILFTSITFLTHNIEPRLSIAISNISARVLSATSNYLMKRKLVFKSSENILKSSAEFFVLAIIVMFGNTLMMDILTAKLMLNKYIAKIITELTFFILNYLVQKIFIFKKSAEDKQP